jgi:hypothetical protein
MKTTLKQKGITQKVVSFLTQATSGVGGIPPAEPSQFRSDIFKQTPQRAVSNLNISAWI